MLNAHYSVHWNDYFTKCGGHYIMLSNLLSRQIFRIFLSLRSVSNVPLWLCVCIRSTGGIFFVYKITKRNVTHCYKGSHGTQANVIVCTSNNFNTMCVCLMCALRFVPIRILRAHCEMFELKMSVCFEVPGTQQTENSQQMK